MCHLCCHGAATLLVPDLEHFSRHSTADSRYVLQVIQSTQNIFLGREAGRGREGGGGRWGREGGGRWGREGGGREMGRGRH